MKASAITMIDSLRTGCNWLLDELAAVSRERRHWINFGLLLAGVLLIAVPLLSLGLFGSVNSDHKIHVCLIQHGIESGNWPVHFLYPASVYALSGFRVDYNSLATTALVFLAVCVFAKAFLTYIFLVRNCPPRLDQSNEIIFRWSHETLLVVVAGALMVAAPIARPWWINRIYLGQISPNVWHNPTSLVCWPLAILLFFAAYEFLRSGEPWALAATGVLAFLSVLAKPNYFLAFAPVFGLCSLWRFGLTRQLVISQAAMLPTVVLLLWQLMASFGGADTMRPGRTVTWLPLAAWHVYSNSIPLSILFSLAFPLAYVAVFWRSLQNRGLLVFAWGVMLSALVWTACFAEVRVADGAVDGDFNFSWGSHLAIYLLFLVTAIDMCSNSASLDALARKPLGGWMARVPWWLLGAHAASGVFWIIRQAGGRGFG